MHVSPPDVFTGIQADTLSKVSSASDASIDVAAREVEGLFVSMLLKQMRQSGSEDGMFAGESSDTLGGMFDLYLGKYIAESGGIGLADSIEKAMK